MRKPLTLAITIMGSALLSTMLAPSAAANTTGDILVVQSNSAGLPVAVADVVETDEPSGHCEEQTIVRSAATAEISNLTNTPITVGTAAGCNNGAVTNTHTVQPGTGIKFSIDGHLMHIIEVDP